MQYDEYPEYHLPDPVHGGRIHAVATSLTTCTLSTVSLAGTVVFDSLTFPSWDVDWILFYPFNVTAGQPIWFAWHSNLTMYDAPSPNIPIVATCSNGDTAVNDSVAVRLADVILAYVTTTTNYSTLLVHLSSNITQPRTISSVVVNGIEVVSLVSPASLTIGSYPASVLLQIPLSTPAQSGQLWTVVVSYAEQGSLASVGGGRHMKTFFPIESWPHSVDCPYPTINTSKYNFTREHGIDTLFVYESTLSGCNSSLPGNYLWDTVCRALVQSISHPCSLRWSTTSGVLLTRRP